MHVLHVTTAVFTILHLLLGSAHGQKTAEAAIPFKENDGCMGKFLPAQLNGQNFYLVPLQQAVECYRNMTIDEQIAFQTVDSYNKLFELAYTFYDIAKDAPDSDPLVNTMNWKIYSGPEEGQVSPCTPNLFLSWLVVICCTGTILSVCCPVFLP